MKYAIVSDIHANFQAWSAVLDDISTLDVDGILCLGDVIGYGPLPAETLESVYENADNIVLGNHDAVIAGKFDSSEFNDNARDIIEWTREQLSDIAAQLFAELPSEMEGEGFLISHAEVLDPERFNYIEDSEEARESFHACESKVIFVGHTHVPAVFVMDEATGRITAAEAFNARLKEGYRYIVNVGSVGDPRDDDVRSCYCIYDTDLSQIFFRRVEFDIEEYRSYLIDSGLNIKPDFLKLHDGEAAEAESIQDWVVHDKPRPTVIRTKPKRIIRVSHEDSAEEDEKADAERQEKERNRELLREAAEKKKLILEEQQQLLREKRELEEKQRQAVHDKMQRLREVSARRAEEERIQKEKEEEERLARKAEAARKVKEAERKVLEERKRRKEAEKREARIQMQRARELAAEKKKRLAEEEKAKALKKAERARELKEAQEARAKEEAEKKKRQTDLIHQRIQTHTHQHPTDTRESAAPNQSVESRTEKATEKPIDSVTGTPVKKKSAPSGLARSGVKKTSYKTKAKPKKKLSEAEAREIAELKRLVEEQKQKEKEKKERRSKRRQTMFGHLQKMKNKVTGSSDKSGKNEDRK